MAVENQALDLGKLASGTNGRVAAMLAELEGHAFDSLDLRASHLGWTQTFAPSGKTCQPRH